MSITRKQKEVFDYISTYIHTQGVSPTQKEIKEHFNFKSFGSVQRYLKYLKEAGLIDGDWNAKQGLQLGPNADELLSLPSTNKAAATPNGEEIPLLGDIAAGNPIEAIENPTETLTVPPHMIQPGAKYYALRVKGDSMIEEGILEDDYAIIRYQSQANKGQIIAAVVDGEATLKTYFPQSTHIELHPANSRLTPIKVGQDQHFQVAGVLAGIFRFYE